MRFHLVSLPHTHTIDAYSACAFTEKVRKFAIMMTRLGHEVFLYAGAQNDALCTEHIPCISEDDRRKAVGDKHYCLASFDSSLPHWRTFNGNALAMTKTAEVPAAVAQVLTDAVNAGQMTPEQRILAEIDFAATNYYRSNSLLDLMGLTPEQIDQFFIAAAQI